MSDPREPIKLLDATPDTVTLRRADYEALLSELDDVEDRMAVLQHQLARATHTAPEMLSVAEADRVFAGESPLKVWREKRGQSVRGLAAAAGVSPSLLSEIESGTKTGSVDTLRKLAHALKTDLDSVTP